MALEQCPAASRRDGFPRLAGNRGVVAKLDAGALAGCAPGRSVRGGPPSPLARGNPNGQAFRRRSIRRAVRAAIRIDFAKAEARTEIEIGGLVCRSIGLSKKCNKNSGVTVWLSRISVPDLRCDSQYRQ